MCLGRLLPVRAGHPHPTAPDRPPVDGPGRARNDGPGPCAWPPARRDVHAGAEAPPWRHEPPPGAHRRRRPPRRRLRAAGLPAVPRAGADRGGLPRVDPRRERQRRPVSARRSTRGGGSARVHCRAVLDADKRRSGTPRRRDPAAGDAGGPPAGPGGDAGGRRLDALTASGRGGPAAGLPGLRPARGVGHVGRGGAGPAGGGPGLGRGRRDGAVLPRSPRRAHGPADGAGLVAARSRRGSWSACATCATAWSGSPTRRRTTAGTCRPTTSARRWTRSPTSWRDRRVAARPA